MQFILNCVIDSHFVDGESTIPLRKLKGDMITIDSSSFVEDIKKIKSTTDSTVMLPVYDRNLHDPVKDSLQLLPQHSFVFIEGLFLLEWNEVRDNLDLSVFLDVDEDECHKGIVERKVKGGRTREDAEAHFERVDIKNIRLITSGAHKANVILTLHNGLIHKYQLQ
jgi:pantothenate kinase